MKTIEEYFRDWENHVFGYGYGSGEEHTIPALQIFLDSCSDEGGYDHRVLESALISPTVAWLLINTLCHHNILEYGTSPRFGWLTEHGKRLKEFVGSRTEKELIRIVSDYDHEYRHCDPSDCSCGENEYEIGRACPNPFWRKRP